MATKKKANRRVAVSPSGNLLRDAEGRPIFGPPDGLAVDAVATSLENQGMSRRTSRMLVGALMGAATGAAAAAMAEQVDGVTGTIDKILKETPEQAAIRKKNQEKDAFVRAEALVHNFIRYFDMCGESDRITLLRLLGARLRESGGPASIPADALEAVGS